MEIINLIRQEVQIMADADGKEKEVEKISQYLKNAFSSLENPLPDFLGKELNVVNVVKDDTKSGYEFIFPKIHSQFMVSVSPDSFRYRHDEVLSVLTQMIEDLDLEPLIEWNRGYGMFVYNVWEKQKDLK